MFNAIIKFSLKNRLLVVSASALLLVYGVLILRQLPVDVFPDLNRPTVTVMTEAPGLSPEEVETLVTLPIETSMSGAPGVERVRSQSGVGLSVINIEFAWGTDIHLDRQLVTERLNLAKEKLPEGYSPVMGPISSIMGEILLIGMSVSPQEGSAQNTSPMEVRTLADWVVRPRLLSIPGVSQVIPIGGEVKQFQVILKPEKLLAFDVSLDEVEEILRTSNLNTTGGFVFRQGEELLVRNFGRFQNEKDISSLIVATRKGFPIALSQLAEVKIAPTSLKRGDASVDASPAVILSVQKQPGADTVALTEQVEAAIEEIRPSLPKDVSISPDLFRQATFIEAAIDNVTEALRDGALLVVLVLLLFLMSFRTTLITLTAIPLSFVVAALVFHFFGMSVNTMTLGGLAVAIGELVDDAIVDVENVFRRLRENQLKAKPEPPLRVIYHASLEVRSSIVYATILVVLVFIPLFSLSGIEGRLFAPLGVAYIVSIIASLFVSLTVTPALCSLLLSKSAKKEEKDSFLVRWLKRQDQRLLRITLRHPNTVMVSALFFVIVAVSAVPLFGTEFLPSFNEGTLTVNLLAPPGTSLEESNKIGTIAERLLLGVPEVTSTGRRTGRAELDEHAEGVHYTEIDVDLSRSKRSREEILADIRQRLSQLPGVVSNVGQPISHRLDHLLSGVRAQIALKIFGPELDTLRAEAEEIRQVLSTIPGVADLQVEKQVLVPQLSIRPIPEKARLYGLNPGQLAELLEVALAGEAVTQVVEGQRTFDVVLRYPDEARANEETLRRTLIDTPSGTKIPLGEVALVTSSYGPNQVNRENSMRRIVVSCNTQGRDLGAVITDIQHAIETRVELPSGYYVTYGGQFESQQAATRLIALLSLVSLAGMILVLYSHFPSMMIVLQILLNIPLSLIGAVIAIWISGGVLSVATLVGFVTLTGIASRNGIMMISHYLHLMKEEGESFSKKMIIRGSMERLVPVLMTTLTAMLALIPLAISRGAPGKEILQPVAVVILGGLLSSTLLDIVVTPAVFWRFGKKAAERLAYGTAEDDSLEDSHKRDASQ